MRARIVLVLLVIAVALIAIPTGSSYGEAHPNAQAQANCGANIAKQIDRELSANGGVKDGELGPTNCDHFFHG